MQKKKLFIAVTVLAGVVFAAAAAFLGGQMFNRGLVPLGTDSASNEGDNVNTADRIVEGTATQDGIKVQAVNELPTAQPVLPGPASQDDIELRMADELPTTQPEVTGTFVDRQDNTVIVQATLIETLPGGGLAIVVSPGEPEVSSPRVEVVITHATSIYADVTSHLKPSGAEMAVEQIIEAGSLDEINPAATVAVWGRKVGDRVIADVLVYSNPIGAIQK